MPPMFLPPNAPNILHTSEDSFPQVPQRRANAFTCDYDSDCDLDAADIPYYSSQTPARDPGVSRHYENNSYPRVDWTAVNVRRETNYTDRGQRQQITPFGLTRVEMDMVRAPVPTADAEDLFVPDNSLENIDPLLRMGARIEDWSSGDDHDDVPAECETFGIIDEAFDDCACPISYDCTQRPVDRTDCRPLVPQFKEFTDRLDEESYEIQRAASPNQSGNVATPAKLAELGPLLDIVQGVQNASLSAKKSAIIKAHDWILEIGKCDVTPKGLELTQILPRLKNFLGTNNHSAENDSRRSQGIGDWLVEELTILYLKWEKGDLLCDQNRGLKLSSTHDVNATKLRGSLILDKSWQFYRPSNVYGHNGLVNGQLWHSRLQLLRDGGHGSRIGGISGSLANGAYSVVMGLHTKNNKYADVDMLDVVEYEGTALPDTSLARESNRQDVYAARESNRQDVYADSQSNLTAADATRATQVLMRSIMSKKPVRLFRSFRLSKKVLNRPVQGYRYDGLYQVVRRRCQNKSRQIWSFRMERLPGQGRLRGIHPNHPQRSHRGVRKAWNSHCQ